MSAKPDNDQPAPIRRFRLAVPRMAVAQTKDGGELLLARLSFGRVYAARLGAAEVIGGDEAKRLAKMVDGPKEAPPPKKKPAKKREKKQVPTQPS